MTNFYFELEKMKEFKEQGVNQKKMVKKLDYQVGKTNKVVDRKRTALSPGKRVSRTGHIYWETRMNRSDMPGTKV